MGDVSGLLREMGVAGGIISVLMGTIGVLSGVIYAQWRHANKVYGYRLAERDVLNKALTDSANAMQAMLKATEERNDITESLADVIEKQSVSFVSLTERIKNNYDGFTRDFNRFEMVITAMSDSIRQVVAISSDIRNSIPNSIAEIKNFITSSGSDMIYEISKVVANALNTIARRKQR